jgi:hypothetical protein
LALAAFQIAIAFFARASSERDILSDGACIGGAAGMLGGLVILVLAALALLVLAFRSLRAREVHQLIAPLLFLVSSSGLAFVLASSAALRCTV